MDSRFSKEKINWRTKPIYVDIDTGEILTKEQAKENYIIITTTRKSHVYKSTGTTEIVYHCKPSRQIKLF